MLGSQDEYPNVIQCDVMPTILILLLSLVTRNYHDGITVRIQTVSRLSTFVFQSSSSVQKIRYFTLI